MLERRTFNRRLGPRVAVEEIVVEWRLPVPGAPRPARRRRQQEEGSLVDVSVGGALVSAPTAHDLSVGAVLFMAVDGHAGKVRIRRMAPGRAKGETLYGVEFCEHGSGLSDYVRAALSSSVGGRANGRRDDDVVD